MKKVLALACFGTMLLASSVFGATVKKSIPFYQVNGGETFFVAVTNVGTSSTTYTLELFNTTGTSVFSTSPTIKAQAVDIWDTTDNLVPTAGWGSDVALGTGQITSTSGNIAAWAVVYAVMPGSTAQTGFTVTINGGNAF